MSDYPDRKTLRFIGAYDIIGSPIPDLFDFIVQSWWMAEWGARRTRRRLYLSTGGWSGNESIIEAMRGNWFFWSMCWVQSRRGGHYIFELPIIAKPKGKSGGILIPGDCGKVTRRPRRHEKKRHGARSVR